MSAGTVIVMAKQCLPGRVKTRLHPPFTLAEAAEIAQACLNDTVQRVSRVRARRVLCVQGTLAPVEGFVQVPQSRGRLDERIGDVLDQIDGRVLLIGMDTPQLDPSLLQELLDAWPSDVDAWLGPATDGGFWLLGVEDPSVLGLARGDLVRGVAMSRADTGVRQRARLDAAGLRVAEVPALTDVDDVESLHRVVGELPEDDRLRVLLSTLRRRDDR